MGEEERLAGVNGVNKVKKALDVWIIIYTCIQICMFRVKRGGGRRRHGRVIFGTDPDEKVVQMESLGKR